MFEGLFVWRNGCKYEWMCLDEGCIEMGVNDLKKYMNPFMLHTLPFIEEVQGKVWVKWSSVEMIQR